MIIIFLHERMCHLFFVALHVMTVMFVTLTVYFCPAGTERKL